MNWNKFINEFPRGSRIYLEMGKKRMIDLKVQDKHLCFAFDLANASVDVMKFMTIINLNIANGFEALAISRVLADGPKIFSPNQLELELMEQMSLNIQISDYVQPFETIVIELPDNYIRNMRIECPQAYSNLAGYTMPKMHQPVLVVLYNRPDLGAVVTQVVFDSMQSIKTVLYPSPDENLNDYVCNIIGDELHQFENTEKTSKEELEVVSKVLRACLNYCLLLDEIGVKCVGSNNPSYHSRLQRYVEVAMKKKDEKKIEEATDNLITHPIHYEIKQKVKLARSVKTHNELPEQTGRGMPPHHRRGYYKMQPYGTENSLRKRIRIPPVFVNKHLFLGDLCDTEVRYS
jgi:hypothetical protein